MPWKVRSRYIYGLRNRTVNGFLTQAGVIVATCLPPSWWHQALDWADIAKIDWLASDWNGLRADVVKSLGALAAATFFGCRWRFSESTATLG